VRQNAAATLSEYARHEKYAATRHPESPVRPRESPSFLLHPHNFVAATAEPMAGLSEITQN
jgi:hypothetical protein